MKKTSKLIIANCPEKFKIFDFGNFSRSRYVRADFVYPHWIIPKADFEFTGSSKM